MNSLLLVAGLAMLPAIGNFAGAISAEFVRPSPKKLSCALHAAAGIVIAMVGIELLPEALDNISGWWVAAAFGTGGIIYLVVQAGIERATQRKGDSGSASTSMWMIYFAVLTDLVSDGLMIGTGGTVSMGFALVLALGQVLADFPEGYATTAEFRDKGISRLKRLGLSALFLIPVELAAVGSFLALRSAPQQISSICLVILAGILTVTALEDMLKEAHEKREDSRSMVLAFIGGFVLFTAVSAGLGQ